MDYRTYHLLFNESRFILSEVNEDQGPWPSVARRAPTTTLSYAAGASDQLV